jgi:hypothetical protein
VQLTQTPSTPEMRELFCQVLIEELSDWTMRFGRGLVAKSVEVPALSPWQFIYLSAGDSKRATESPYKAGIVDAADAMAATEIVVVGHDSSQLWIGRLNQARYWSSSQARLAARNLIWEHVEFLTDGKAA